MTRTWNGSSLINLTILDLQHVSIHFQHDQNIRDFVNRDMSSIMILQQKKISVDVGSLKQIEHSGSVRSHYRTFLMTRIQSPPRVLTVRSLYVLRVT